MSKRGVVVPFNKGFTRRKITARRLGNPARRSRQSVHRNLYHNCSSLCLVFKVMTSAINGKAHVHSIIKHLLNC